MGEASTFRLSDQAGLAVAVALHAALGWVVASQVGDPPPPPPKPEPAQGMVVSLVTDVSLESTSPNPVAVARASKAPVRGDPTPDFEPAPEAAPRRVTEAPKLAERKETAPSARSTSKPKPKDTSKPKDTTKPKETKSNAAQRSGQKKDPPKQRGGATDFGDAFKSGFGTDKKSEDGRIPASQIGASAKASLQRQINSQIKPRWQGMVPQGVDADKLVSLVSFQLNEDGTLKGQPSCRTVSATITPANKPQVGAHCERAIRAVQLAAPFKLPPELYNGWKTITNWEMKKQ